LIQHVIADHFKDPEQFFPCRHSPKVVDARLFFFLRSACEPDLEDRRLIA
jgi:hypothetical protein